MKNIILKITGVMLALAFARLVAPLSERQILRSQIVDQMRIRTPVRGGKWLLEQLGVIEGSEELGRSTLYVAQGDELLQQADGKLRRLKELIEGMFQGDTACVNGYVEVEPSITGISLSKPNISESSDA